MDTAADERSYPVQVAFEMPDANNRFWAIPWLGLVIKLIILIPHLILLSVLGFVLGLVQLVLWIPVLLDGRYPGWGYALVGGTLRWNVRVSAYVFGLTDAYPPFRLGDDSPGEQSYPVQVEFAIPDSNNRFWAIPLLGFAIKLIILIPHLIILRVLGFVLGLVQLVLWIPVLFGGRYPGWGYALVGGTLRWNTRVGAYLLGLTDQYPPFRLAR